MGAGSSLLQASKISSGNELLMKTKDVREMSNALFTFMFSQWEDKEIWEISKNPDAYVVALSDLITTQFHVLGYRTKRNKIGEIYFAKYSDLKPPSEGTVEGEKGKAGIVKHRENIQLISFYFVRLFQIMGAMLMVIKDISFPITEKGLTTDLGVPQSIRRPYVNQEELTLSRFMKQRGGASNFPKETPLGPYEFLRYYLKQVTADLARIYLEKYGVTILPTWAQISPNLFFEYAVPTNVSQITAGAHTKQKFWILTTKDGRGSLVAQDVLVYALNPGSMTGYLPPGHESFNTSQKQFDRYPISVTIRLPYSGARNPEEATVNRYDTSVKYESYATGAEYKFESGTFVDSLLGEWDAKKNFTDILDRVVLNTVRKTDRSIQLYRTKKEEVESKAVVIGKMPDSIKSSTIDELYKAIKTDTTKDIAKMGSQPHCIARAIQLLDTSSIQERSPLNPLTSVCKFAVGDQVGPVSLSMYKPIKALAQLYGKVNPAEYKASVTVIEAFIDTKDRSASKEPLSVSQLKEQPTEAAALKSALDRISKAFNILQAKDAAPFDSFSQLSVGKPAPCGPSSAQPIRDMSLTLKLQGISRELLAYHVNHTIEISKFLKVIFNIAKNPDGSWKVEGPKTEILFAGFPILNQLTDQARELLVDYYSGCEALYQKGLKSWTDAESSKVADQAVNLTKGLVQGPVQGPTQGPIQPRQPTQPGPSGNMNDPRQQNLSRRANTNAGDPRGLERG